MAKGDLGRWLEEKCRSEGLSLRQAAARTGLSHATIQQIINGASPSPESIRKLVRAFGGNGRHGVALEDKLLVLAGYRMPHPEGEALSEPLAQLIDKLSQLSDSQLKVMGHFVDFLSEMESK